MFPNHKIGPSRQERKGLLLIYGILVGLMILWHLIGAIVISVWGVEESKVLVNELRTTILKLIYDWDVNPRSSRILRQIQEYVSYPLSWQSVVTLNFRGPKLILEIFEISGDFCHFW
jgi:hypothetical protein